MTAEKSIKTAYRRYAGVYDRLFGRVFEHGRRLAGALINTRANQRILEVGVGTGLSLPSYRADSKITGIDLSREMLDKARARKARDGLPHVEALLEMNALDMSFADHSFDAVIAMYVFSVVSDPIKLLAEMRRVCVPGGDIVLVNHFASTNRLVRAVEKCFAPLSGLIGFRPDHDVAELFSAARLDVVEARPVNLLGYWTLVHFRNTPCPGSDHRWSPEAAATGIHLEAEERPTGI